MARRPMAERSPSWRPSSVSSSRTRTSSCSSARSSAKCRSAPATWAWVLPRSRRVSRAPSTPSAWPISAPPIRTTSIFPAQAGRPCRRPCDGAGDARPRRADDRSGRRRHRAGGCRGRRLPKRREVRDRRDPRHGVRGHAIRADHRHARGRGRADGPPAEVFRRPIATSRVHGADAAAGARIAAWMGLATVPLDAAGLLADLRT